MMTTEERFDRLDHKIAAITGVLQPVIEQTATPL